MIIELRLQSHQKIENTVLSSSESIGNASVIYFAHSGKVKAMLLGLLMEKIVLALSIFKHFLKNNRAFNFLANMKT